MKFFKWAIILLLISPALAHDKERPELNSWFDGLKSGQGLCCSFADGTAIADSDWDIRKEKYWVRVPTRPVTLENPDPPLDWIMVPDNAVITVPNLAGKTMVWPVYGYMGVSIRCFMPGEMT